MRYQYMSLAYFFTAGAFATGDDLYLLISAEKCGKNWHTWFNLTNHLLKYELCNCFWALQHQIIVVKTLHSTAAATASS